MTAQGAAPPGFVPPADFVPGDVPGRDGAPRLHYWRHGRGRPLLVLHGVTDWGLDWASFARRVGDVCACVLLDQRGHGYSEKPDAGYGYADLAADAWRVIEALGLERPAVLGHSMGGGVALALAAAHPQEIDRLLLIDPAIRLDTPETGDAGGEPARPRPDVARRRADLEERQALGRETLRRQMTAARPTFDPEDVAFTVESTLLVTPAVWGENRWMDPAAQEAQLRRLARPTLVVRGEPQRGAIVGDAMARRIRELVPDDLARVTTIAGTGHVPHREALALFVAVVRPFLTGETAPPAEGGSPVCFAHLLPGAD
jgi:pimeloyl-ACP methyl ester carboxylesterase